MSSMYSEWHGLSGQDLSIRGQFEGILGLGRQELDEK